MCKFHQDFCNNKGFYFKSVLFIPKQIHTPLRTIRQVSHPL